jgi:uncharacterized membrane protein
LRKLVVLPVAVALTMALVPATAFAAEEGLSGYNKTTTTTTTTTTPPAATTPTPTTGTSPSKESSTPSKTTAPETSSTEPSKGSEPTAKASTLPFTGFDLRWTIGAGVLLLAMGLSIMTVQRRQRRGER